MRPVVFVNLQTGTLANGGLESITEVMSRLSRFRPVILTNCESRYSQLWRSRGMDVHICPEQASAGVKRNPLGTLQSYRRYYRALREILARTGARVVHANDPMAFQLSLAAVKFSRRARIALNLRGTLDPSRRPRRFKFRLIFGSADHVFYLSADMAERWRQVAGNATRACSVTYSIVDPGRFAPSPPPDGGSPVVLHSGIFGVGKGQLSFIHNVVPRLAAAGVESWFAGDFEPDSNPYAAECAAAAEPFKDKVRFLGFRTDMPELLRQASVIVITSQHEGLSRGMAEAMSIGRPVVSFDVCSAREILIDKSAGAGSVVSAGDHAGMTAALLEYATDREALAKAGNAGTAAARVLFDPDQVVDRYERVYRELHDMGAATSEQHA